MIDGIPILLSPDDTSAIFSKFLDSAPHFPSSFETVLEVDLASHHARVEAELREPILPAPL